MEQSELRSWIEHRAEMLWVCVKCLVLMIVGIALAISWGSLSDNAELALSITVAVVGLFLWFGSHGAIMDIAAMRSDMDDALASTTFGKQFSKAPFPVYLILNAAAMLGSSVMLVIVINA
ncbi:MAG: hypothetical protein ACJZ57_02225 [Candidatus Poriferisodalaceae bacterium]|nr:MAG: hypothetical protein CNE88_04645 [Acidimicrobiales bacterium MED-G01]